jgi:hypothetical protein
MRKEQAELNYEDSTVDVRSALHILGEQVDLHFHMPLPENSRRAMRVTCLECSRTFKTSSFLPTCPGCGGSDIEPA